MGSISEYYSKEAVREISKGYVKGGIFKLKATYPVEYDKMEKKLERNFNREGVDKYVEDLIAGLKEVGAWSV